MELSKVTLEIFTKLEQKWLSHCQTAKKTRILSINGDGTIGLTGNDVIFDDRQCPISIGNDVVFSAQNPTPTHIELPGFGFGFGFWCFCSFEFQEMRAGLSTIQQMLTPEAANVLNH
ncbi:hypothetical protein TB2_027916 [Malus domestica]